MPDVSEIQSCLSRREIEPDTLRRLAEAVAGMETGGFPAKDVFPVGIIVQDGAGATFEVKPGDLGRLVDEIARLGELRPEIKIFPKGIIVPDTFEVTATFGRGSR